MRLEEVLVTFLNMSNAPVDGVSTVQAINDAAQRIGDNNEKKLRGVAFASDDVSTLSPGAAVDLRLEVTAFTDKLLTGQLPGTVKLPRRRGFFITLEELREIHSLFNRLLRTWVRSQKISIKTNGPVTVMLTREGISYWPGDKLTSAALRLMRIIEGQEHSNYIRQCKNVGCGHWFLADRKDASCCTKKTCLLRSCPGTC